MSVSSSLSGKSTPEVDKRPYLLIHQGVVLNGAACHTAQA